MSVSLNILNKYSILELGNNSAKGRLALFLISRKGGNMDISSLTITVPTVIALVGCFIGIMNFLGARTKNTKNDEARLVSMEKDIQYIRMTVDGINEKLDKHDERISHLEAECERRK